LIAVYLRDESREVIDSILDLCADCYQQELDLDAQIDFKSKAKAFVRTYQFLVMIQPRMRSEWEKQKTFLKLLIPKLPTPQDDDLTRGILESVDLESYRVERQATVDIILEAGGPLNPPPPEPRHSAPEPLLDTLDQIIADFNTRWGTNWNDGDRILRFLFEDVASGVQQDAEFQNAQQFSDEQNARVTHDKKVSDRLREGMHDQRDLYQRFVTDRAFQDWLLDTLFRMNWHPGA
jgi:type I restriction enzyme, R subunit